MFSWHWLQLLDVTHAYRVMCVVFLHNGIRVNVTVNSFWGRMIIATGMTVETTSTVFLRLFDCINPCFTQHS
jgi:hypothetical protein